jgi:hypothetical protein
MHDAREKYQKMIRILYALTIWKFDVWFVACL